MQQIWRKSDGRQQQWYLQAILYRQCFTHQNMKTLKPVAASGANSKCPHSPSSPESAPPSTVSCTITQTTDTKAEGTRGVAHLRKLEMPKSLWVVRKFRAKKAEKMKTFCTGKLLKELELGLKNRIPKGRKLGCLGRKADVAREEGRKQQHKYLFHWWDKERGLEKDEKTEVKTESRGCFSLDRTKGLNWEGQWAVVPCVIVVRIAGGSAATKFLKPLPGV